MKIKSEQHRRLQGLLKGYVVLMVLIFVFASGVSASTSKGISSEKAGLMQFTVGGQVVGFQPNKVYLASLSYALRLEFIGTKGVMPEAEADGSSDSNGAPPLGRVKYADLWPGISVTYETAKGTTLKSTYRVEPEADIGRIQLAYNVPVEVQKNGSLRYSFQRGYMTESTPLAWQELNGKRIPVSVSFKMTDHNIVGFRVSGYDARYPLVIDPSYEWHTFYGASTSDNGMGIAVDWKGDVYVVGYSSDTWQGDGGANPLHAHSGARDIVVVKLNSSGAYQWHTFYGSSSPDNGMGIAVDWKGNVYVGGYSLDTWQGEGGAIPLHSHSGGNDFVVLKLNGNGAYQWHTFYGSSLYDECYAIAVDGRENVYVTGYSADTWQGDGGANPLHAHSGGADIVVLKLDSNGVYKWHTFYGTGNSDGGHGIAVDGSGDVYITGASYESWQGDGGKNPLHAYSGSIDIVVLKLNSNGAYQWHTFYGTDAWDYGYAIAVDEKGDVYVAGYSLDTWQGDGGVNSLHTYSGSYDIVVIKLNSKGAYQWHTFYGSGGEDVARSIAVDGRGNVYVTGYSNQSWQGDGGANPLHVHSEQRDIVVVKLNSSGAYQWHTFYGSGNGDLGRGIALDESGNVLVTAYSYQSWQGDGGANPLHPHNALGDDIVVLKLYDESAVPVQPSKGTIGTKINISGSGFGTKKGKVLIGSVVLKILSWSDGSIQAQLLKPLPSGPYDVIIQPKEKGESQIVLTSGFTVKTAEIHSIEQGEGSAYDQITIRGRFLGTGKGKVYLEYGEDGQVVSKSCKVTKWWMDPTTNESEIFFIVPKMLPEVCDVVVVPVSSLPEAEEKDGFIVKAPEIISVDPKQSSVGGQIAISGNFFGSKKPKVYLGYLFNGKPTKKSCSVISWINDKIIFMVPTLPVGTYDVIVTNSVSSTTLFGGFLIK